MCELCCCLWRVRKLSGFNKIILIRIPKIDEGLGLVINDRIVIFECTIPLPFGYIHIEKNKFNTK